MARPPRKRKPTSPKKPRRAYDGGMKPAVKPPRSFPHAACPRCGRVVPVCVSLGYELFAHRTPMPESVMCDYPRKVHPSAVFQVEDGMRVDGVESDKGVS